VWQTDRRTDADRRIVVTRLFIASCGESLTHGDHQTKRRIHSFDYVFTAELRSTSASPTDTSKLELSTVILPRTTGEPSTAGIVNGVSPN